MIQLSPQVRAVFAEAVHLRRQIHQYPELGFQEYRTSKLVAQKLKAWHIKTKSGVAKTGVVGLIEGKRSGKTLLVRADMDALPITEENKVPYVSRLRGAMHA